MNKSSQGKIRFFDPVICRQVQLELIESGFTYEVGQQAPRHCYGLMWRDGIIRTAGNERAFKAYGVPEMFTLPSTPTPREPKPKKPTPPRGTKQTAERARVALLNRVQADTLDLVAVVLEARRNIGQHEPNLYGTNSRSQARLAAWKALYQECIRLHGRIPKAMTLLKAIRQVLAEQKKPFMLPDNKKAKEYLGK